VLANSNILLQPPTVANPKEEIGVVWINGALCSTEAYRKIAVAFQEEAAANGIKAWVDIPSFVFETPEPLEMSSAINSAKSALSDAGFKGSYFVASHSLGTVQIQSYLEKNPDAFEASIMMGGGLTREKYVNNNSTGLTEINHTPSLSIHGTKDGLYRISRSAEAYYHQVENIDPKLKNLHPVVTIEGGSHGTFMDETMLSSFVFANDLMPEIT
jgi:pimeloyl-ACP methyl ester carboxylesterase